MIDRYGFLAGEQVRRIQREFGTPVYVYDQRTLEENARAVAGFPNAFGLTPRYAMKALSAAAVLRVFAAAGLHIDASSGFEVERAIRAGIPPVRIRLTAQQLPNNLKALVEHGVLFTACSIHQLKTYGELFPGSEVSIRVNPGLGTGHSNRTNVGGPSSSFGIWHERLDDVERTRERYKLRITGLHSHIGSGGDPEVWKRCAKMALEVAARLPDVKTLNLGGGFKVARVEGETTADLTEIGNAIRADFEAFHERHGRKLHLEIEPGTWLVANAGAVVATVIDVVDTGKQGYAFVKIDSGMTEVVRPSMYGAQHPIWVVPQNEHAEHWEGSYLVVGHCCESGDVLTPEPGNPEGLRPRALHHPEIGDAVVIGGCGAYCSAMPAKNYNSFPEAPEVLLTREGAPVLIRRRQTLEQMLANEIL